jgi:GTP cyclohydrolase I
VGNPRVLHQLPGRVKPNPARLQRAVADFLKAAGFSSTHGLLQQTPKRVAEAWLSDFIDGYAHDPAKLLGRRTKVLARRSRELVVVTNLRFHSVCPHHLLPWEGTAHLAYVPDQWVVGFGRLAALLDALAHRLILQEELAVQISQVLFHEIPSLGAACILEGKQDCLRLRGKRRLDATTHAEAYEGVLRKDSGLRRELWERVRAGKR